MMNDELDLLEVRLNTLASTVEMFVIVESKYTHTGLAKPLHFLNNKDRFKAFHDQILYIEYFHKKDNTDPWYHENNQRNIITAGLLKDRPKDGLIFISDADEIPRPSALVEAKTIAQQTGTLVGLVMEDCLYYMNYVGDSTMKGPYLINPDKAEQIHSVWKNPDGTPVPHDLSAIRWHVGSYLPQYIHDFPMVVNGGWHFSSLGGIEPLKRKIESCAHWQFNNDKVKTDEYLLNCIKNGTAYYEDVAKFLDKPRKYSRRDISFLPEYVQNNQERFQKYLLL